MKPLKNLNNVERAKLLHDLCPDQIPALLDFMSESATYLEVNQAELRESWGEQFFSYDDWLKFADDVKATIEQERPQLIKRSRVFADQLFDGLLALWTVDTVLKYVDQKDFPHGKFKKIVEGIFGPDDQGR